MGCPDEVKSKRSQFMVKPRNHNLTIKPNNCMGCLSTIKGIVGYGQT